MQMNRHIKRHIGTQIEGVKRQRQTHKKKHRHTDRQKIHIDRHTDI